MEHSLEQASESMYTSGLDSSKLHTYQKNKDLHLLQMREAVRNSFLQPNQAKIVRDLTEVSAGGAGLSSTLVPGASGQSSPGSFAAVKSMNMLQGGGLGSREDFSPKLKISDHIKQPSYPAHVGIQTRPKPSGDPFKFTFNPCPQPATGLE